MKSFHTSKVHLRLIIASFNVDLNAISLKVPNSYHFAKVILVLKFHYINLKRWPNSL